MPPKADSSNGRSSRPRFSLLKDKGKQGLSPTSEKSRPSTPSGQASSKFDTKKALRTTRMAVDGLKSMTQASNLLGPFKIICDALKLAVTTAEGIIKNEEELKDLVEKLQQQFAFINDKTSSLTDTRFRPSRNSIRGVVKSLEGYASKLDTLQDRLESLQSKDNGRIRRFFSKVASVESDREELGSCTRHLDESFQQFMHAVTFFIADQTAELLARQALNQLPFVEGAQGSQHSSCLKDTRKGIIRQITEWATDSAAKPVFCLVDQAGTGKSTISAHMARQWDGTNLLTLRFFFSKPVGITSGQGVASTLARAMAAQVPLLRSFVVQALDEHSNMLGLSIREKLELLVFTPLKKLKAESDQVLGLVRKEMQEKVQMNSPDLDAWHECIMKNKEVDDLRKLYMEALNTAEKDTPEENHQVVLETAYMNYLKAMEESLAVVPVILIDALDECSEDHRSNILRSLLHSLASFPKDGQPFKILLTSRPEKDIMSIVTEFQDAGWVQRNETSLHSTVVPSNRHDVTLYTISRLADILDDSQIPEFVTHANGLFLWASTAAEFILSASNPSKLINNLLRSALPEQPLDQLYTTILDNTHKRISINEQSDFINVLKLICKAREPLSVEAMDELLDFKCFPKKSVSGNFVMGLSSVLSDGGDGKAVQALHPTFLEFIPRWRLEGRLLIPVEDAESLLAESCLTILLSEKLKYDILDVTQPGEFAPLNEEIEDLEERIRVNTTPSLRYAATHGISHAAVCLHNETTVNQLQNFYETKLLYWIELMSYLGKIYLLIQSIHSLAGCITKARVSKGHILMEEAAKWTNETSQMLQPFQETLEESALQVYRSALPFTPSNSIISHYHSRKFPNSSPRVVRGAWGLDSKPSVLSGHTDAVHGLQFSPDGRKITSASSDLTIRRWDVETGTREGSPVQISALEATRLVFSPDGLQIASTSKDFAIRIWDVESGLPVRSLLKGHTWTIGSLAFSSDGRKLASGSADETIRLWDVDSGITIGQPLGGHSDEINCLAFSPDGRRIASGSQDCTIRIWDAETGGEVGEPLRGHTRWIRCVRFSLDGLRIVSGSEDSTIRIWDAEDGSQVNNVPMGHTASILSLAFSPDGRQIASGSFDLTVRLWDLETYTEVGEPLIGHTDSIWSLAFSPDGRRIASGSADATIRLWGVDTDAVVNTRPERPADSVSCLVFSPYGHLIASGSSYGMIRLWDTKTGAPVGSPFQSPDYVIMCLAFSPDGRQIASRSINNTIRLWDVQTGSQVGAPLRNPVAHTIQLYAENDTTLLIVNSSDVYDMSTTPPSSHKPNEKPPMPVVDTRIQYEKGWTCIRSKVPCRFRLPSNIQVCEYSVDRGRIAYGCMDGTVVIVDCLHLL